MPGAEEDGPSQADQVTGRILGPVERAIFEKYKRKVCNDNPTIPVDCNPAADCYAAEPVVNDEDDMNENLQVAEVMVDDPMVDYNFGCMDKLLEDPDNVPVAEATGLQLLAYFDKVLPPENEIDNLISLANDGSLNEPVVHSDSAVPFFAKKSFMLNWCIIVKEFCSSRSYSCSISIECLQTNQEFISSFHSCSGQLRPKRIGANPQVEVNPWLQQVMNQVIVEQKVDQLEHPLFLQHYLPMLVGR
jgi:hypothetical protein